MERNISDLDKIRKAKNNYNRQWRKRNPDKFSKYQSRYWLKVAKKLEKEGEL